MTAEKKLHVSHGDGVDASIVDGIVFVKNVINWGESENPGVRLNRSEAVYFCEWLNNALHSQAFWETDE